MMLFLLPLTRPERETAASDDWINFAHLYLEQRRESMFPYAAGWKGIPAVIMSGY
jgi:hypothetical protein